MSGTSSPAGRRAWCCRGRRRSGRGNPRTWARTTADVLTRDLVMPGGRRRHQACNHADWKPRHSVSGPALRLLRSSPWRRGKARQPGPRQRPGADVPRARRCAHRRRAVHGRAPAANQRGHQRRHPRRAAGAGRRPAVAAGPVKPAAPASVPKISGWGVMAAALVVAVLLGVGIGWGLYGHTGSPLSFTPMERIPEPSPTASRRPC